MTNLRFLRRYAETTPGGLPDPQAASKLWHEFAEFIYELVRLRIADAATETADIHYYHAKLSGSFAWLAGLVPLVLSNLAVGVVPPLGGWLARSKYTSRGAHGKDKLRERLVVLRALMVIWVVEIAVGALVFAVPR